MNKAEWDALPKRRCTKCGLRAGNIGFPECFDGKEWRVSHDMQELKLGHPYYESGHWINADGACNMGCC